MTDTIKPLPFDPQKIKGLSEKILVSHYENNYGGAVRRLNLITEQPGRPITPRPSRVANPSWHWT